MSREKLHNWATQMHLKLSFDEIDLMIKDFVEIKKDKLANKYLQHEIKRLSVVFYGKEISDENLNLFVKEILRNFSDLSCSDVKFCFEKIIDNKTEVSKYFNISEVSKVLFLYKNSKSRIRQKHFELLNTDRENEYNLQKTREFTSKCIKKFNDGELLNVYEKSAIGIHFEDKIKCKSDVWQWVQSNIDKEEKKLKTIQNVRANNNDSDNCFAGFLPLEETGDEPLFWTDTLLYGFKLFENLVNN